MKFKSSLFFYDIEILIHLWNSYSFFLNKTALIFASSNGHTEVVQLLINKGGFDINDKDI